MDTLDMMVPITQIEGRHRGQGEMSGREAHAGRNRLTFDVFAGAGGVLRWDKPANSCAICGADIHSPLTLNFYVSSLIRTTIRKNPLLTCFQRRMPTCTARRSCAMQFPVPPSVSYGGANAY